MQLQLNLHMDIVMIVLPSIGCRILADNNFNGSLPASLKGNQHIKLNINGNNITRDNPLPTHGERNMKQIIIGVSVGSVILFLLLVGCVFYACLRFPHPRPSPHLVMENNVVNLGKQQARCIQSGPSHVFTYEEIVKITCNFGILIGEGGSGSVYYGRLDNGNEVAAKVLKNLQQQGSKQFVAEVKLLMTVHHRNLISFIGFCEEDNNMVILYQYMQNGTLRDLLSGKKTITEPLTWIRRLKMALDVATGTTKQTFSPKRVTFIALVWFFLSLCVVVQPYLAVLTSVLVLFNGQLRRLLRAI
ncbi:probable LRR receptor-like serine/threonine-protein kinase At4g20450 [Nymphaea colorata]|nr:probable LRR receptor-like serine/threonine-protein kinase At4g20450 [Nymphaea colorata]